MSAKLDWAALMVSPIHPGWEMAFRLQAMGAPLKVNLIGDYRRCPVDGEDYFITGRLARSDDPGGSRVTFSWP